MHMLGNGGKAPKISVTHIVAVYDPADGRVFHMHHAVVFEGGKSISQEQASREAVESAKRHGHDTEKLKTLLADGYDRRGGGRFRVDLGTKKLVALAPPRRRSK
jgi:hypothetical protein